MLPRLIQQSPLESAYAFDLACGGSLSSFLSKDAGHVTMTDAGSSLKPFPFVKLRQNPGILLFPGCPKVL
jgi:hypothetical protein